MNRSGAMLAIVALLAAAPALAEDARLSDQANKAFLQKFAQQKGVTVTPSGLEIRVVKKGNGKQPSASDTVLVAYRGQLITGQIFDQTQPGKTATFPVGQLIPGWTEALQRMHEGDEWQIVVPPQLAYGAEGAGPIPPNQALVFEMQLIKVVSNDRPDPRASLTEAANKAFLSKFSAQKGVLVTNSGIAIKILQSGYGKRPSATDKVQVNYRGQLVNGAVFDMTEPGLPATFQVNHLIPGWTEALQKMREGDHWQIAIPANLAYGQTGNGPIPPDQVLVFDLELLKVMPKDKKDQAPDPDQK